MSTTRKFVLYPRAHIYFSLLLLLSLFAFFPTYFDVFTKVDFWHHVHGNSAGLWMLLLVIQPILYQRGQLKAHRVIGRSAFILIPLIVIGGLKMVHIMTSTAASSPVPYPYIFAFLDLFWLCQLVLFFALAMKYRRNVQYHARYMVLTALVVLPPALGRALGRIPRFREDFYLTLNITLAIVDIILLLLILDDRRSGRIRKPYVIGLILFGLLHLLMNFVGNWQWWKDLMDVYGRI